MLCASDLRVYRVDMTLRKPQASPAEAGAQLHNRIAAHLRRGLADLRQCQTALGWSLDSGPWMVVVSWCDRCETDLPTVAIVVVVVGL